MSEMNSNISIDPSGLGFDSALEIASTFACDSNAGVESEVLLSIDVHSVEHLTNESSLALFAAELQGYDKPGPVYRIDWTAWVCKKQFDIHEPWKVVRTDDYLYLVEEELLNADFDNQGMGFSGRFLEWSQNCGESYDASTDKSVPSDVVDELLELVPDWGYEVDEWFGDDEEELSDQHPLLVNMLPRFRKVVMDTIRKSRG